MSETRGWEDDISEATAHLGFASEGEAGSLPAFPHFGHNGRVGWPITRTGADNRDLYIDEECDAACVIGPRGLE